MAVLNFLKRFFAARAAHVAVIFSLVLVPVALGVGGAVDFGQALNARARLASALDAAALAVGGSPNLSDAGAQQLAENFLSSNYTESQIGRVQNLSLLIDNESGQVTISAESAVRTALLGLMGLDEIVVRWETEVRRARRGIELAMVLDTSGSMAGTPIQSLRNSVTLMIDILFDNAEDLDKLSIGLVPFSTAVSVGTQHAGVWWLDPNAQNPLHREEFSQNPRNRWTQFTATPGHSWGGCVEARRIPYDIDDTPPDPAQPDTLFFPYFAPDEPDAAQSCGWWGCSTTRRFTNTYRLDQLTGDTTTELLARLRYTPKYGSGSADTIAPYWAEFPSGPNWLCVSQPITQMTNNRQTLTNAAQALSASGGTNIPLAIGWGIRLLSPGEPFPSPAPYNDRETIKALVIMTDGDNQMLGGSSFSGTLGTSITNVNRSLYSAYGYSRTGRVGSTSSNTATLRTALDDRTRAACDVARARGVRVYTIVFGTSVDSTTQEMMRACATSPNLYFYSPSSTELENAFEVIAGDLSNLRLAR